MGYGDFIPGAPDSLLNDPVRRFEEDERWEQLGASEFIYPAKPERESRRSFDLTAESGNELRPVTFDDIVGQDGVKDILATMIEVALRQGRPLPHVLFVGPSGMGKTTFAHVCAHALGKRVIQLEAPVSHETLVDLAGVMQDGDILFLDEIHQQSLGDRRGRSSSTQPEVLFSIMEDRTLPTSEGVIPFPHITIFGATTDEGMLPDAFINRFPIRPALARYTEAEMTLIAMRNGPPLGVSLSNDSARIFAGASRGVPREVNNYVRLSAALGPDHLWVDEQLAFKVLRFAGVTIDGLTRDMQNMLTFLYLKCRQTTGDGETVYRASIERIATGIGKSRDSKAVALRVEPWLIEMGYIAPGTRGRALTEAGELRAMELTRRT